MRVTRSSSSAGSAGVSFAGLIAAIGYGSVCSIPSIDDAPQPLQRDLDRVAGKVDALVHARRDADATDELLRVDRLVVIAAGDDERDDQPGSSLARSSARFSGAPICTAMVPSGYTIVERSAMSGSVAAART